MNFAPSDRIQPLLDQARAFLHQRIVPHELQLQREGFYVHEQLLEALRAEVKALGLWAPQLPEALGGLGLTLVEHGLFSEVLGQTPYGHYVFGCQAPDAGNIEVLHAHATPAQRERFLQPLVFRLALHVEEPQHPVLLELVAKTGKIEAAQQVFNVEGGKAKRHLSIPWHEVPGA